MNISQLPLTRNLQSNFKLEEPNEILDWIFFNGAKRLKKRKVPGMERSGMAEGRRNLDLIIRFLKADFRLHSVNLPKPEKQRGSFFREKTYYIGDSGIYSKK